MEPTPTTAETCPNCNSEITFKEKDGAVEYWDCPNCGKINLKKEQLKKNRNILSKQPVLRETQKEIESSEPIKTCQWCLWYHTKNCAISKGRTKKEAEAIYEFKNWEICHDFKADYKKLEKPTIDEAINLLNGQFDYVVPTDTEEILGYDKGYYRPVECDIKETLENYYGCRMNRNFVNEVIAHIQRANYIARDSVNVFTGKIPIENGFFCIKTEQLTDFDKDIVFTYKLNIEHDENADCPKFKLFLKSILPDKDAILMLQEFMGYILLPEMPFHKIFWFYGKGRNGKGVIIRTVESILGKENVSALNLSEFSEKRRFALQRIYGKSLNVSSEPQLSKYGLPTTVIKMVTGQDRINAEVKGKNKTKDFVSYAKCVVLGNHFPKVDDNSLGWWDRVEVLTFPNNFLGKDQIPDIEKQWLEDPEERAGIFNFMLEGLHRILENNGFTKTKDTEENKAEFMKASDPFNAWMLECCVLIPNAYLTREEAFTNCQDYCDEIGADRIPKRNFYEKLRNTSKVRDTSKKITGKTVRVFEGITLKTDDESSQQTLEDLQKVAEVAKTNDAISSDTISLKNIVNICEDKTHANSATSVTSKTELEKLEALRNYIVTERKDSLIHVADVTSKIQELELEYEKTILMLRTEALLLEDSNPEFWRVTR